MKSLKQYFNFSKKDTIGAIVLVLLILLTCFLPEFFPKSHTSVLIKEDSSLLSAIKTIDSNQENNHAIVMKGSGQNGIFKEKYKADYVEGELFKFDPNTLNAEGWQRLGLNEKRIQTIIHYREKGGHFYKAEDLEKIWGLPSGFYNRVKPYIDIPNNERKSFHDNATHFVQPKTISIDINQADTADLVALNGIGVKLATRIINFRNKLGGFYSVDQIRETYGLPDSTYEKIKPYLHINANEKRLKMVNINAATKEELKAHPYIKWNLANAIVSYRMQHGPYLQLTDLKKITIITDSIYNHLSPYLTIQ